MGADGGINWVKLRDVSKKDRFRELTTPFEIGEPGSGYGNDYYDHYHDAYLEKHPFGPEYVIGTYGSFQEVHGIDTLREMLDEALPPARYVGRPYDTFETYYEVEPGATFVDLLESYCTEPAWRETLQGAILTTLRRITGCRNRDSLEAIRRASDKPVFRMSVRAWATELREMCDWKTYGSDETWT